MSAPSDGSLELPISERALTMDAALRDRVADSGGRPFLRYEEASWTYAQTFGQACRYANLFLRLRDASRPFHVGVLMDNLPEFLFAELGCALARAVLVGLNPTRSGSHLARDIAYADCQIVLVEGRHAGTLAEALSTAEGAAVTVLLAGEPGAGTDDVEGGAGRGWRRLEGDLAAAAVSDPGIDVSPTDLLMIVFTSGTTRAPKGVLNSHGRLMMVGWAAAAQMSRFTPEDTIYAAMPLYHANAQVLAVVPALVAGGTIALAHRFSKTAFLADVRRYGATLFNYVGNPLAYIMETPERPDDADNPLRLACGNEAPRQYVEAFARRFGCQVVDGYGASEVGVGFARHADDPPRSLGRAEGVKILDAQDRECPPARFDAQGRLANAEEAVGEIVNTAGSLLFEGYYKDDEATRHRTRNGFFYTGDLGYRDEQGYIYFAGRDAEWLRVGGENFLARPVEEILARHPDVVVASVYGVPDPEAGDQVMAALELRAGAVFDPLAFGRFVDAESDLPQRWRPTFVRVATALATTATNKVMKRVLRKEKFLLDRVTDPVYWRPRGAETFEPFTPADLAALRQRFERAGQQHRLEG
jgi:fatty-acyl-CoA synthase